MRRLLFILMVLCFLPLTGFAQSRQVTGKILNTKNEPVIGAVIKIKDKVAGITDIDGNYSVKAAPEDILNITSMGMLGKKIKVGNHSTLNVVLEESAENMDAVVVAG